MTCSDCRKSVPAPIRFWDDFHRGYYKVCVDCATVREAGGEVESVVDSKSGVDYRPMPSFEPPWSMWKFKLFRRLMEEGYRPHEQQRADVICCGCGQPTEVLTARERLGVHGAVKSAERVANLITVGMMERITTDAEAEIAVSHCPHCGTGNVEKHPRTRCGRCMGEYEPHEGTDRDICVKEIWRPVKYKGPGCPSCVALYQRAMQVDVKLGFSGRETWLPLSKATGRLKALE